MNKILPLLFLYLSKNIIFSAGTPYDLDNPIASTSLETIARISVLEANTAGARHCCGMDIFLETRDKQSKKYLWFADIAFHPSKDAGIAVTEVASTVTIKYSATSNYFTNKRPSYGTPDDLKNNEDFTCERVPVRLIARKQTCYDAGMERRVDYYNQLIKKSILEFSLETLLSIKGLFEKIKDNFITNDALPLYSIEGYSHTKRVYNCATFSVALLVKLGIRLDEEQNIKQFLLFNRGHLWGWWSAAGVVVGGGLVVLATGGLAAPAVFGYVAADVAAGAIVGFGAFESGKVIHDYLNDRAYPYKIISYIVEYAVNFDNNKRPRFVKIGNGDILEENEVFVSRVSAIQGKKDLYKKWCEYYLQGGQLAANVTTYML